MITVWSNNKEVEVNRLQFSDGAITFKLEGLPEDARYISVNVDPSTPVRMVREEITLIADCIHGYVEDNYFDKNVPLTLNLPHLPYGRADRKFEKGNPQPLRGFLWTLEDIGGFDEINICDIHNSSALVDFNLPIKEKNQLDCYKTTIPVNFSTPYDYVLAPDKGSVTKAASIGDYLGLDVYNCGKVRDVSTGQIVKSTLPEEVDFKGKVVLIPDDLCDGGYTFIKLAEQLKSAGAKQVDLYVTHLIASKGLDCFEGLIDNIYCYHTVGNYVNKLDVTNFNNK